MKLPGILLTAALLAAAADDRAADREAIRAHIDRIFQAFIHKDAAELRATHDENWRGFLEWSDHAVRGIDQYMQTTGLPEGASSPYGMIAYRMREFDVAFNGDSAFAVFVAEVDANTPAGTQTRTLRIGDFYAKKNGAWIQAGSDTQLHPESIERNMTAPRQLSEPMKKSLLEAREAVWHAYFANDRAAMEKLIPEDLIAMNGGNEQFGTRASVFEGAAAFAQSGGKLVRIAFPQTEIQCYGATAIIYTRYEYELEVGGKRSTSAGKATEIFVFRDGQWVNPGWHLDGGK
jgi:hypothetical protein